MAADYIGALGEASASFPIAIPSIDPLVAGRFAQFGSAPGLLELGIGDRLLDSVFAVITHVLRARRCSIMLVDDDQHLVVRRACGLEPDIVAQTRLAIGERVAGHVAATRQPVLMAGGCSPNAFLLGGNYATGSFASVPIVSRGKLYGVLNTADKLDGDFDHHDLATLTLLAQHVALCIEDAYLHGQISQLANTDDLTGVYNHRYFQHRLEEEMERARRFGRQVALLMTDLDCFKEFNDQHGHPAGDVALRWVSAVLYAGVRRSDIVCRYGGDEFAIIAPETNEDEAVALGQRLIDAIARQEFHTLGLETSLRIGLSIGVSAYPRLAASKLELVEQADSAMYLAKHSHLGVCGWSETSNLSRHPA